MPFLPEGVPKIIKKVVTEIPSGATAVLNCSSNDYDHNFMFWFLNDCKVIGPYDLSGPYDDKKYKYEVLSGKLLINSVSPGESGSYKCLSSKVNGSGLKIGEVELNISGSTFSAIDAVNLVAILVSIIVIIVCAVIYYRLKKEWDRYEGHKVIPVDDTEDEQEDTDEIYNRTTTTINQATPGPSRDYSSEQLLYGIDNQGLDTDFNSVFENIQIKSPHASLI